MVRRVLKWFLFFVLASLSLVFAYDRIVILHWVGHIDLTVEFAVTDSGDHLPVPGACIEVESEGSSYRGPKEQEFVLVAGADGKISKECPENQCMGVESGFRFSDSFWVSLPSWQYRTVAEGYESSEWAELDAPGARRKVRHTGPGKTKLVVPVSLHKKQT